MENNKSYWMPAKEAQLWRDYMNRFWNGMLFGPTTAREPKEDDNVKLAWVSINGTRTMVGLDNTTMIAYKLKADVPSWILPLEPIEYDSFERWCTTFDV
jgi:hypothetical protein